ncbi:hypothetical protein AAVH_30456, partial [Aphelenchoides avenae]
ILIANKTQENHRYILEQTAWTALKFFAPQATRPHMWTSTPQMQTTANQASVRFDSVGEKLLELDMLAAEQGAPSGARRAGGLPSMTAEELRKKIAKEQLNHTNKSILDQAPEGETANVFETLMMDFSPNVESFQEMDVRRERANSGQGHMAAPSIDDATDKGDRESSDSKNEQRTSPAPLDYEAEEAAAAAYEADVLEKAKYLAARVTFPGGKTLAEKKAEPAIVQAAAETFAERKARGQRIKAAIEESKKDKPSGFSRRDDSVVLDYPEFDDSYWDIENCPRPFELAEPANTSRWSIMLPNPKRIWTEGYARTITNVSQHFTRMFPHVRFYHILAPFTRQQGRAWHDQLHAFIDRIRNTRLNATLIMHPTDMELCGYYDECQLMHLDNAPWPTDEHTPEGHLSDEGLRRRKEFMEVHYNVELWRQREHDEEADRQEEEAAQELAEELEEMGEQTRPSRR